MVKRRERVDRLISAARDNLGYRARPFKDSVFGLQAGYGGQQWDGAFLESVRRAADFGGPSLVSSNAALAWFVQHNLLYPRPKAGDVAFFAFSVDGEFGQPHVGLVTEVLKRRFFRVLEGQVSSGTRNGNPLPEEVCERIRHRADVIGFGRLPDVHGNSGGAASERATPVRLSDLLDGRHPAEVEAVQTALSLRVPLHDATRGKYDAVTQAAMWKFQRERGLLAEHGKPSIGALRLLADETGIIHAEA